MGRAAGAVGKGLVAGFAATLAITASQMIEMQLTGRKPSSEPADAAAKVLDIKPNSEVAKERFSQMVHFGYGTAWGAALGLLYAFGIKGKPATATHYAAITGASLTMPAALKVSPPASEWTQQQIVINLFHHLVYAVTATLIYESLDRE